MNLITLTQVAERLHCSRGFVWELLRRDPNFPRPFDIGIGEIRTRGTRFAEEEIGAWIETRRKTGEPNDLEDGRIGGEVHQAEGEAGQT